MYHDPPSNKWYGMQPWSADRLAQYYYVTGDSQAGTLLNKWVGWVLSVVTFYDDDFSIPASLSWSGDPPNVQVTITEYGKDLGEK